MLSNLEHQNNKPLLKETLRNQKLLIELWGFKKLSWDSNKQYIFYELINTTINSIQVELLSTSWMWNITNIFWWKWKKIIKIILYKMLYGLLRQQNGSSFYDLYLRCNLVYYY